MRPHDRELAAKYRNEIRRMCEGSRESDGLETGDWTVHYCWHSMYGRSDRLETVERRANGPIVSIQAARGVVIKIPAWMLDPAACANMALRPPLVCASPLADLHELLIAQGFRRSSRDDHWVVEEECDEVEANIIRAADRAAAAEHGA